MVKLITVIEVCTQTTQNHQSRGQPQNKDDCEYQYAGPGEWQEGTEMQFCTDEYGRRRIGYEGVPLDFIAKLGGWKKLETLKKYLLASGLDVAMVGAEYEFFR